MFWSCGITYLQAPVEVIMVLCVWWCKLWLLWPAWRWQNWFLTACSIYLIDSFQRFISVNPLWPILYVEQCDVQNVEQVDLYISDGINSVCWANLFESDRFFGRECTVAWVSLFDSERSMHLLNGCECALAQVSLFDSEYWFGHKFAVVQWVFHLLLNHVKTFFAYCVTCCNTPLLFYDFASFSTKPFLWTHYLTGNACYISPSYLFSQCMILGGIWHSNENQHGKNMPCDFWKRKLVTSIPVPTNLTWRLWLPFRNRRTYTTMFHVIQLSHDCESLVKRLLPFLKPPHGEVHATTDACSTLHGSLQKVIQSAWNDFACRNSLNALLDTSSLWDWCSLLAAQESPSVAWSEI